MKILAPSFATLALSVLTLSTPAPAQELRHALASADAVVLATEIEVQKSGKHWLLHRLRVIDALQGEVPETITVVELRGISRHARPGAIGPRLYCLHGFASRAKRVGLPAELRPYFKMGGYRGGNPRIGDRRTGSSMRFARVILAAQKGASPQKTAAALIDLALRGAIGVRTEAVLTLAERPMLRAGLGPIARSQLLSRAVAETDDIPFKIALAELCAELHLPGLVDALCLSMGQVADARFPLAVGRIARVLHGEGATDVLRGQILKTRSKVTRGRLLLALGATGTESALVALLRMRRINRRDPQVAAALRAHGSKRALEATSKKPVSKKR